MVNTALVGKSYQPSVHEVTAEAVEAFAQAVGDPCYSERGEVPITFGTVVATDALRPALHDPELGLDATGRVHGGQEFEFNRPIRVGDRLTAIAHVEDVYKKRSLNFGVLRVEVHDRSGEPVFSVRSTMIVRDQQ
jgi:N-terminal half of MaoC dehydratase